MNAALSVGCPLSDLPCVASKVDLFGHLLFEWTSFGSLSTDRQIGMSRGSIPWSALNAFAERYHLVDDDFDRFSTLIRAMDQAYLAYFEKKSEDAKR